MVIQNYLRLQLQRNHYYQKVASCCFVNNNSIHHKYIKNNNNPSSSNNNILRRSYATFDNARHAKNVSTLILLRHGKSQWNGENERFSGWCDVPLTVRGRVEAVAAGQLLRRRGFQAKNVCVAFSSELQRAHETCELVLASMAGHEQHTWSSSRIRKDWRLNERHYGALQGHYKNDPELASQYGQETLLQWRRSMHGRPPPMTESHPHYQPPPAPLTENLQDCQKRVVGCWEDCIAPSLFDEENLPIPPSDRTIIVVAHANTIRSLMAHFDNVPDDQVQDIFVPNSVPILYRFNSKNRQCLSVKLESGYGDSHARWMLSAENHYAITNAHKPGGTLTRALFDAIDHDGDMEVTGTELEAGLKELRRDNSVVNDCVVMGVAEEISRQLRPHESMHYAEFERRTRMACQSLTLKHLNPEDKVVPDEVECY